MKVSVIISNRNDAAMLAITVRSCLEEFKDVPGGGEVVIADNSDQHIYDMLESGAFISKQYLGKEVKLLRQDFPCLFTARELAIRHARAPYVICLDGHMIVGRGMIRDLVAFMDQASDKVAFAHAPICWLHHHERQARHDRDVSKDELGPWGSAYSYPRRITWKGMPWICRKKFFLEDLGAYGALSEHKISWGGGDMHIGVKPWLLGFENWAVPTSPGYHIGPFPESVRGKTEYKYRLYSQSGNQPASFGFLLACYVLGGDAMMERNYEKVRDRFGWKHNIMNAMQEARTLGEREKRWLDERKVMSFQDWLTNKPWNVED